jgi:predicted TIM-barrel fold metal-dependent hydrolase
MKIIDAHVHVGLKTFCKNENSNFDISLANDYMEFIKKMDLYNIDKAIILPIPHKDFDSGLSNDYLISAYNAFPDRFIPFCRIDDKLEDNFKRGFKGAKIHFLYEETKIEQLKNTFMFLEDIDVPVIVHALFSDKAKQIKKILKIAPNLKIILAHMGRGHIYTDEGVIENAIALKKYDNIFFETSTIGNISAIKDVCNIIGEDRVIFGSDYPFGETWFKNEKPYNYSDETDLFINSGLKEACVNKIMCSNISNLLYLNEDISKITVRKIKNSDFDRVTTLFKQISDTDKKFLALKPKITLIKQQIKAQRHCYVAVKGDKITGFMRESGRPEGYSLLEELLVHPEYRRQGIAGKMLRYYHRIFSKTLAKTNAKNDGMIKLLKCNGYYADNPDAQRIVNWTRCDDKE